MLTNELHISREHVHKLLCTASGDTCLLYLYLQGGNRLEDAGKELHLNATRLQCAAATLRQLGLWQEKAEKHFQPGERPSYSETDVMRAMDSDRDFRSLYQEIQCVLGKNLNTEELKILLGFTRYLGLGGDVISLLVTFCKDRARMKGSARMPSLRTIEKEAYHWAEAGIDTMEEAVAYIHSQNVRSSRLGKLQKILQIGGRNLTAGEDRYATQWLDWGFAEDAIAMAYERTCLNTGGLSWAYMNKILTRWHQAGLLTAEAVRAGDKKPVPQGASGQLGQAELEAIQRLLQED